MKNLILTVCFIATLGTTFIYAATEQWAVDGQETIIQVAADGKGGCAMICSETNDVESIFWINKKVFSLVHCLLNMT